MGAAADSLREADRRKDEFLAMLAHELRNPLAPLVNAHRLLARSAPPSPRPTGPRSRWRSARRARCSG